MLTLMALKEIIDKVSDIIEDASSDSDFYDDVADYINDLYIDEKITDYQNMMLAHTIDNASSVDDLMATLTSKTFENDYNEDV